MFTIKVETHFDAAHFLQGTKTKCDSLHGHRWSVWASISSMDLSSKGWVVNFVDVKKWIGDIIKKFDHSLLNYYIDQPTAENLCFIIFRHLHKKIVGYNKKYKTEVWLNSIEIKETPGSAAIYSCFDLDIKSESLKRTWQRRKTKKAEMETFTKKQSKATKASWKNKEHRERRLVGIREANEEPALRKHRSDRMKINNPMHNRQIVEKMIIALRKTQKISPNKGERKVIQFFKKNNLPFHFVGNGDLIIGGKIPDFVNEENKIVVEYNSRFWHSNDNPWYNVKNDSKERKNFFAKKGYRIYVIWDDIFQTNEGRIKTKKDLNKLLRDKKKCFTP